MADRRMMSKKITDTDAFLEMPLSSQALYFHFIQNADDDGFVGNPNSIIRKIGANRNDYDLLVAKRFVLIFPTGICVIKHWRIHNYIQNDRYTPTTYLEEKSLLMIEDNKAYTERCIQDVSKAYPQIVPRQEYTHDNAYDEYYKDKACSAAWMKAGVLFYIFYRKLLAGFITGDGLVFCAVVHKGGLYAAHK